MERIGVLRHFKRRFAVERGERRVKIHDDLIFLIQVQIEFLDLPGSVFLGGSGELVGIRSSRNGFLTFLADELVPGIAVFAVDVVRDDDFGLEAADLAGELFVIAVVVFLLDIQEDGKCPYAAEPQPFERFAVTVFFRVADLLVAVQNDGGVAVYDLHAELALACIGRDDAAHHDEFIV